MEEKFDSNVLQLEKEIYNITNNINYFKNKNHTTMKNMMEKLKSFSNEPRIKHEKTIENQEISKEKKKKSLIKTLSNGNITPNMSNNKIYQYEKKFYNNQTPITIRENYGYNNGSNSKRLYSNYNSDIRGINKSQKGKTTINIYDNKTCKSNINKDISYIINNLKNEDQDNNDIKRRTKSFNRNIKVEKFFNNDITNNDSINNDFIYEAKTAKHNKVEIFENLVKNSNDNKSELSKKLIKNIKSLIKEQKNKSKQINNVKREHCNINISEYYKNLNSKVNSSKKKSDKIKIVTNNKKLRKYPSARNSSCKIDNISIRRNDNISNMSTRNSMYNKKYSNTNKNKKINYNNSDYNICVCTTFNPDFQTNNNYNEINNNYQDEMFNVNSFNDYNLLYKNMMIINNNKKNNLKDHRYYNNKKERNSNNSYNYNNKVSFNIDDEDIYINKNKLITNNNYSKDFIDIVTKRNKNNYNDSISMYNNNDINEKKSNKNNKYI